MSYKIDDLLKELESEKTASAQFEATLLETEKPAAKSAAPVEAEKVASATTNVGLTKEELVEQAQEMGQIAAHSFFSELAAMGIAMPTTKEVAIPPISQVSRPQASPVTVAYDAQMQEAAGHHPYDALGAGRFMQKMASENNVVLNLYNKIYNK